MFPSPNIPVLMRVSPTFDWYKALMDNTIFPSITSSTILFVRRSKTLHSSGLLKERYQQYSWNIFHSKLQVNKYNIWSILTHQNMWSCRARVQTNIIRGNMCPFTELEHPTAHDNYYLHNFFTFMWYFYTKNKIKWQ